MSSRSGGDALKKAFIATSLIILVLLGLISATHFNNVPKYRIGKDTVARVGDGKFQIMKFGFDSELKLSMYPDDSLAIDILLPKVTKYKIKGSIMYVIGVDGYAVVDGKTNSCRLLSKSPSQFGITYSNVTYIDSYDKFTDREKKVFQEMELNK